MPLRRSLREALSVSRDGRIGEPRRSKTQRGSVATKWFRFWPGSDVLDYIARAAVIHRHQTRQRGVSP
jgi:hypothetical protein